MAIECEIGHTRPDRDGGAVYRVNGTELPARWRCRAHLASQVDADEDELIQILVEGARHVSDPYNP